MAASKRAAEQGVELSGEQVVSPSVPAPIVVPVPVPHTAAGAMDEILEQTVIDALNKVRPDQLIGAKPNEELTKGNTHSASAWIHALANLQLLARADQRLTRVANVNRTTDVQVGQVNRVDARLVPGTKLLILRPASDRDQTALEVKRYKRNSGAWVNLFDLLAPDNLTVETGYQERYAVSYVPKSSPLWPALVINLDKPLDRKLSPKQTKQSASSKRKPPQPLSTSPSALPSES